MTLYITQYGPSNISDLVPSEPALSVTSFSSAAQSTSAMVAGARMIEMYATGANAWVLITGSTSAVLATSTNARMIVAGAAPIVRYVSPLARISVLSS